MLAQVAFGTMIYNYHLLGNTMSSRVAAKRILYSSKGVPVQVGGVMKIPTKVTSVDRDYLRDSVLHSL